MLKYEYQHIFRSAYGSYWYSFSIQTENINWPFTEHDAQHTSYVPKKHQ